MAETQLDMDVFLLSSNKILAAGDTDFVRFCRYAEALVASQGAILKRFLVPVAEHGVSVSVPQEDVFSDDEVGAEDTGFLSEIKRMLVGDSLQESAHESAAQATPQGDGRGMSERAADTVVTPGLAPGAVTAAAVNMRHRPSASLEADATTYQVEQPLHGYVAVPLQQPPSMPDQKQWYIVDKISLWHAFVTHIAILRVEGSLVEAVKGGRINLAPGTGVHTTLQEWNMRFDDKITTNEAATRMLVTALHQHRHNLADPATNSKIQQLIDAVIAARSALLPSDGTVAQVADARRGAV